MTTDHFPEESFHFNLSRGQPFFFSASSPAVYSLKTKTIYKVYRVLRALALSMVDRGLAVLDLELL